VPCLHHARQLAARQPSLAPQGRLVLLGPGRSPDLRAVAGLGAEAWADPSGAALDALGFRRVAGLVRQSGLVLLHADGAVEVLDRGANPARRLAYDQALRRLAEASASPTPGG
jgi:hypothetical protein